ncbi:MAG: protein-tyrosine phosphatase family protein [Dermatophilaceae bacterium]
MAPRGGRTSAARRAVVPGLPSTDGVLVLPDGRRVRAASTRSSRAGVPDPDLAVVLAGRPPDDAPWPVLWVRWPDFRVPADAAEALEALRVAHVMAADRRVEVGCRGGVGRTGTAVAVLAVFAGLAPGEAVAWARQHHHRRAAETPWQRRWVERVALP